MTNSFTSLSDIIQPDVWRQYILEESTVKTNFWTSGILTDQTALLMPQMGGTTVNMPFFNDLGNSESVIIDTADLTADKVTTGQDVAAILERVKAYGRTDLAADLAGADPAAVIISRFAAFWARQMQVVLLNICNGIFASTGMAPNVSDISSLTGGAQIFDGESFIDAQYKLGDHASELSAVAVHSQTMALMMKQDLIDFIKPSDNGNPIPTYMGKLVIVNDQMPVSNGTYTTYLFGPGAVAYAEGAVPVPVEYYRNPLTSGGTDYIINRRKFCLHVLGVKWIGSPSNGAPTAANSDLATGTNWSLVYDPKLVRAVQFKHKLA